ncbi:MAG: S24/S26 family peptidase [Clostridia bacterium]|nr:S24/S26 family peptidase [Clostridia bacterium]
MRKQIKKDALPEGKSQHVSLADLLPLMEEVIKAGKTFRLFPMGNSMRPLLREGKDSVLLVYISPQDVQGNDMILYRREDGAFVLHRVVAVEKDGTLTLRGDSQYYNETGISKEQVIALVQGFYRGGKYHDCESSLYYRFYLFRRRLSYPLRRFSFRVSSFLRRRLTKRR